LVKELAASGSTAVCKECAQVLEGMRQYQEAAELYEHAGNFEKAASLYIIELNFDAAAPLMAKISSPKLQIQFAKAKESRHAYPDAFKAYYAAGDTESCVRLQLYHLKQAEDAMRTVRETRDPVPARQCAEFAQSSDIRTAVEFLVIAKSDAEAFRLAEQHDHMDTYVDALGGHGTNDQHIAIAQFFEKRNLLAEAAEHYSACGEYSVALRYYLKVGESQIEKAIEVVGKARNDLLTNTLIDYLMGESDHVSKDPNYVYRLHKALGNYGQAAQTAVLITKQEQDMGNYRDAHKLMLQTHLDLQAQKMAVPADLARQLMLLHSYTLVKRYVKLQDHMSAAKLLCRVSESIRSFPSHAVPILTSTVIECQRAGLKGSAYTFACQLMTPQYRQDIQEQYKKKIEQVVRKSGSRENDIEVVDVPCLFCGTEGAETTLKCDTCLAIIPYCIVSGLRMLKDDFCACPHCNFPARYSEFYKLVKSGEPCPMCSNEVDIATLKKIADFREEYEPLRSNNAAAWTNANSS
jgi:WD repeat-containing protein 19